MTRRSLLFCAVLFFAALGACKPRTETHLDDPDAYMKRIYFWQDVPRRAKYNEIWNEVKSAQ